MRRNYGAQHVRKLRMAGWRRLRRWTRPESGKGGPMSGLESCLLWAQQDDKLMGRSDLRRILTIGLCRNLTPIQLESWGRRPQISHLMAGKAGRWRLFNSVHESAYKQLSIAPDDRRTEIAALRPTGSNKWFGFLTRTLVFGPISDVAHYKYHIPNLDSCRLRMPGRPAVHLLR